ADDLIYQADKQGCHHCTHGYSGRVGIYEVMPFDEQLAEAIVKGASVQSLEMLARQKGMMTLKDSGLEKLKQGITSLEELQRVLYL
nr:type IV-A pilus assembly ATPase PilB [Vibrio vulnificus]